MTRHKYADVLISIANGDDVQYQVWHEVHEAWIDASVTNDSLLVGAGQGVKIRIKPRTIMIGDMEVQEPMRKEPKIGEKFYILILSSSLFYTAGVWEGTDKQKEYLYLGLVHDSASSAITHAKALIKISGGTYEEN